MSKFEFEFSRQKSKFESAIKILPIFGAKIQMYLKNKNKQKKYSNETILVIFQILTFSSMKLRFFALPIAPFFNMEWHWPFYVYKHAKAGVMLSMYQFRSSFYFFRQATLQ